MKNPVLPKYAIASIGDSAMYSYVNTFWLFYLTTVAGIPPAAAGSITAIGTVAHAVAGPFFAGWSDRSNHKLGRRRPFLLYSALPLGFFMCLMFTKLPLSGVFDVIVPTFFGVVFWMLFAAFFIPHLAWGAEITTDYNERTTIRTFSFVMYTFGYILGNVLPTISVEGFDNNGMSESTSWLLTTVIIAGASAATILFTGIAIRERSSARTKPLTKFSLKALALDYWQVLKLRPLRLLIFVVIAYLIANAMVVADRMYVFTFKMGYSGSFISMLMLLTGTLGIVLAVPMLKLAQRYDKRKMLIISLGAGGIITAARRFVGISDLPSMIFLLCAYGVTTVAYWQLIPATFYDICEVDEYENHVKRAGTITSTLPVAEAIAAAIGMQALGIWLQLRGFVSGAETQSPEALDAITDCFTLAPGVLLVIAALIMTRFPITKHRFEEIKAALAERQDKD
ncbi:MAG: MFS transporter [Clostridiales Family XIII bacterium]|jgi:GPH family glycoside/pentoside/hexuronide:cation symporter|nr:MFS transporter [Clostridiales Family XIII bacterium]